MRKSIWILCFCLVGCGVMIDKGRAISTMKSAGYKDVTVTAEHGVAPSWNGCGHDDDAAFDVTATNPAGQRVNATVCCGWGLIAEKGCTIRH